MKRIDIDFAAPGLRRAWLRQWPTLCLLGATALLLLMAAGVSAHRLAQQQQATARLMQLRSRAAAPPAAPTPVAPQHAVAVNAAVQQLNLPWSALRHALASATPADIALLSLEPDARQRRLRLTAEASSSAAMTAYIGELKQQPLFVDVMLRRHEVDRKHPARPLRFELEAQWAP